MICAEFINADGLQVLSPVVPQPLDLSACAAVVVTGADVGAVALFTFPTQADAATAFAWAFSAVVIPYLAARAVGAVVNFVK